MLGIAHLDHVQRGKHFFAVKDPAEDDTYIFNPRLDDRIGAYVLHSLLPKYGINVDVLLTTDEEIGRTTGEEFFPTKDYNWMFEVDREGRDVVMYQYEDDHALNGALRDVGFHIGFGSFSDISFMDHIGCSGFNVGSGLEHGHSEIAGLYLGHLEEQLLKFFKFYELHQDTRFEHVYESRASKGRVRTWYYDRSWEKEYYENYATKEGRTVWEKNREFQPQELVSLDDETDWIDAEQMDGAAVQTTDFIVECAGCDVFVPRDEVYEHSELGYLCADCYGMLCGFDYDRR